MAALKNPDSVQRLLAFMLPICVALTNVGLNIAAQRVAKRSGSLAARVLNLDVVIAVAIGCASLLLLIGFYSLPRMNIAKAVVLAGSASICIGAIVGVMRGGRLTTIESALLVCILLFYTLRLA